MRIIDTTDAIRYRCFVLCSKDFEVLSSIKGIVSALDTESITVDGMKLIDQGENTWIEVDEYTFRQPAIEALKKYYEAGKIPNYTDIIHQKSGKERRKERRERERKANKTKHRSRSFTKDWEL